ncbi:MAG: hypothetical protein AAF236_15930, partial [Verrucomicrobiota bacterium]
MDFSFRRIQLLLIATAALSVGQVCFAQGLQDWPRLRDIKAPSLPNVFDRGREQNLSEAGNAPTAPGGMCLLPNGEIIISCHQFINPQFAVMKLDRKGNWLPFPNEAMNIRGMGAPVELDSVLGITCDSKGIVWMLDNGRRFESPPKLVAWDTKREEIHRVIPIHRQALVPNSFLKNLVLD